jgi:hypothetical protein
MWASVADRDRAIRILKESFVEGRLTFDEFEERVGRAMGARGFRHAEIAASHRAMPAATSQRAT